MPHSLVRVALVVVAANATGACVDAISDEQRMEENVLRAIGDVAYRDGPFVRVTKWPYQTGVNDTDRVEVYVSRDAAPEFMRIDPAASGSGAFLPPGTLIVREVISPEDRMTALTVMMKGEAGFFPEGGDWFYGVTDPWGRYYLDNDSGGELAGRVADCADCHAERAGDDFLFGVPPRHR